MPILSFIAVLLITFLSGSVHLATASPGQTTESVAVPTSSSIAAANPPAAPAQVVNGPTQGEWMRNLVDALGLSFGLPAVPTDQDYLNILGGNRHLRFEAEDVHQPTDMVSVNKFLNFGPYSGKGWVNGISLPTEAHLRFLLPLAGRYRLSTSVRLAGHQFRIDNVTLVNTESGDKFHTVHLGVLDLPAGETEVVVSLPPNGSIDYLELDAEPFPVIAPLTGWQPESPLTSEALAVTVNKALALEALLPPTGSTLTVEAENAGHSSGATVTDIRHLGAPSNGQWLRAGNAPTTVTVEFTPSDAGVYEIVARGLAEGPVLTVIDGAMRHPCRFLPYLSECTIGSFDLKAAPVLIEFQLPARAGIDAIFLHGRSSRGDDYRRLVGLNAMAPSDPAIMNRLLSLVALLQPPR